MGRILHLARRFFQVAGATPLSPAEQTIAARLLTPADAPLFWAQATADQRHALSAARLVVAARPGRGDLARAALLHDVGKRHAPLGLIGRTIASLLELTRLPAPGRLGRYLDHCNTGAADLERGGAEPIVVAFARHHHGTRPAGIGEADWRALLAADGEGKAR